MTTRMKRLRILIVFGVLIAFLYVINSGIYSSEQSIASGELAYFDLAPRDPRSLIQGDYMVLRYAIEADLYDALRDETGWPIDDPEQRRGQFVVQLDTDRVAQFARLYAGDDTLAPDEYRVNYRVIGSFNVNVGVDSFFFQEGLADEYADARYAEIRITPTGAVHLIELVDDDFGALVE